MPSSREFRIAFFATDYERSVGFYERLGLHAISSWDRGPDDRGTMFRSGAGVIEVLALPTRAPAEAPWDVRPPQGLIVMIEVDDVDAMAALARDRNLPIRQDVRQESWGHRSLYLEDPDGVVLYLFEKGES